jgi:hypothetical protein
MFDDHTAKSDSPLHFLDVLCPLADFLTPHSADCIHCVTDHCRYPLDDRKAKSNFKVTLASFVRSLSSRCRDTVFQDGYLLQVCVSVCVCVCVTRSHNLIFHEHR